MVVAIAVGLWNGHEGDIDPVRLGAVVTTTLAWLAAEIISGRKPSDHDLKLFDRIVEKFPERTTDFIRNHDFHNSFNGDLQAGLFDLAAWEGTRNQFLDGALQKRWAVVHGHVRKLTSELFHCGPIRTGPMFTAHPELGDRGNPEPWVQKRINALNKESSATSKAVDDFEKFARNRLRL
jgi:hypothetical protein